MKPQIFWADSKITYCTIIVLPVAIHLNTRLLVPVLATSMQRRSGYVSLGHHVHRQLNFKEISLLSTTQY